MLVSRILMFLWWPAPCVQIRDAYQLEAFEKDPSALPEWCTRGRPVAFCQLTGKFEVDLPGYNSMQPYAHMNERCPSMPPLYRRTAGC